MRYVTLFTLTLIFLQSRAQPAKFNLGFEQASVGKTLPKGWFKWGDYGLGVDTLRVSGEKSGKITSDEQGNTFGSIAYKIPANYQGESIRLDGFMKIKNVENGFAGLLLRVDGNGSSLVFDNMQRQGITGTHDWKKYSITLEYPPGADNIFVAGILVGKGEAWFDDFVLTIDGQNVQTMKEMPKPVYGADLDTAFDKGSMIVIPELTEQVIDNLELLGKIWGFLKYRHPVPASGDINWDYELFRFLPEYLEVEDRHQRDELLLAWIENQGEVPPCLKCEATAEDAFLKPDLSWISDDRLLEELRERLHYIGQNRHQGSHFYIRMKPNVGNPDFINEDAYNHMSYPDAGFRLLALYRYWNMINYFFPYKHLMDRSWKNALKEHLPDFVNASNELEYELAAIQLIGSIQDTHANLWRGADKINEWKGKYYAPVHLRFIENKPVVADYYNPELKDDAGLEIGDVITKIKGRKINDIIEEVADFYPASNEPTRLRDIAADLLRAKYPEIQIEYIRDKQERTSTLRLYPRDSLDIYRWYRRNDDKCYRFLQDDIGYITLQSIKQEDISKIKEEFTETKGIIIDIRNYPSTFVPFSLGSFFVSSSSAFVKFTKGNLDNPGEFNYTPTLEIPGSDSSYRGKLVVLLNELSQSQAEYTAMAFRAGDNTTIIGSTTAGADGNVSTIHLPGGLRTMISGIGVYYPDGRETQRVGIIPDIEVLPTIEGIKNGRDELLEKAVEVILDE